MIFGLFKKEQNADTVFFNGKIYTQDADMPWAEAVACKDGKIIYVGNSQDVESYIGSDTYSVDLEGKYMLPGLINTHSHPALRIFQDSYIEIPDTKDLEDVMGMISDYIFDNPEEEAYFGYGFDSRLLKGFTQEDASKRLDEISTDKPILLLAKGEGTLWANNSAINRAKEAAQEDGVMMITLPYFLQVIAPFDYEELQNKTIELASEYCSKGFTSIFNAGAPEFMDNIYQDIIVNMIQQDMIKQRCFGSFQVERKMQPEAAIKKLMQKKTTTTELDDHITCNTLKIKLMGDKEIDGEPEALRKLLLEACDRGFDVHIDVLDHKSFKECIEVITEIRNSGYRKNLFILACDKEFRKDSEGFSLDEMCLDNVFLQPSTEYEPSYEYAAISEASSVEEIIDIFTIDAAISLGVNDKLGTIESGKYADFAIFDENPFDVLKPALFKKLQADMTVVAGQIVYDVEEDNMQEWYDIMSGMQV